MHDLFCFIYWAIKSFFTVYQVNVVFWKCELNQFVELRSYVLAELKKIHLLKIILIYNKLLQIVYMGNYEWVAYGSVFEYRIDSQLAHFFLVHLKEHICRI